MTAWSKVLACSCYELGHTWEPSCRKAILGIARHGYKEAFKIYLPLYLVTAVLRKRKKDYYIKRLLPEVLRSTLFLGTNAFSFIAFFCFWRLVLRRFTFPSAGFLPSMCASFLAIICERKYRRTQLAVYMMNVACETVWRMMVERKMVTPIKNGQVLLFSAVSAIYMYLLKSRDGLDSSTASAFKFLLGSSEMPAPLLPSNRDALSPQSPPVTAKADLCSNEGEESRVRRRSARPHQAAGVQVYKSSQKPGSFLGYLPREVQVLIHQFREGRKHSSCRHRNGCMATVVESFLRMFGIGFCIQVTLNLVKALTKVFKSPRRLLSAFTQRDNLRLGAFLGSYAAIFKSVNCLLRLVRGQDSPSHGLVAGALAGSSMMFWKSTTVAMFLASKLAETLYLRGIDKGVLPYIKYGEILIYTVSTSIVFHAAVFEPHSLRPAYWKFLLQMTNGRFAEMNRHLLDIYGTNASKSMPNFWPVYDPRYSSLTLDSVKEMIRQATAPSSSR